MLACGAVIAGLAMSARELPDLPQFIKLENPEIHGTATLPDNYTLEDIALRHLEQLKRIQVPEGQTLKLIGMSMGGMILSILASKYRDQLPAKTKFLFLVTSPNLPSNPAVPESLLASWMGVTPGNEQDFKRIMEPMFSPSFVRSHPEVVMDYVRYRATGQNGQRPKAFMKQLSALRKFNGVEFFSKIDQQNSTFVGGGSDLILGPNHNKDLKQLAPLAKHIEVADMGHMINLERPDLIVAWVNDAP
jgi:pimeloyl-ACP methyl ester carboxylesterase